MNQFNAQSSDASIITNIHFLCTTIDLPPEQIMQDVIPIRYRKIVLLLGDFCFDCEIFVVINKSVAPSLLLPSLLMHVSANRYTNVIFEHVTNLLRKTLNDEGALLLLHLLNVLISTVKRLSFLSLFLFLFAV